jgi:hypothetical protein
MWVLVESLPTSSDPLMADMEESFLCMTWDDLKPNATTVVEMARRLAEPGGSRHPRTGQLITASYWLSLRAWVQPWVDTFAETLAGLQRDLKSSEAELISGPPPWRRCILPGVYGRSHDAHFWCSGATHWCRSRA